MSLDRMDAAFRPGDTLLSCVLGMLSWSDALGRALEPHGVEPHGVEPSSVQALAEQQLVEPDAADDALHFLLGLVAFDRSFRGALERDCAKRPPATEEGPRPFPSHSGVGPIAR